MNPFNTTVRKNRLLQKCGDIKSQPVLERAIAAFKLYGMGKDPLGFVFNHCPTLNRQIPKWERLPMWAYLEDIVISMFYQPRNSELFIDKTRKLVVTTCVYCVSPIYECTMMQNQSVLWTGQNKDSTTNLYNQYIKETIREVDIPLLPMYETADTLEVPYLKTHFFTSPEGIAHFTGPEYTRVIMDEWTYQKHQDMIMLKAPDTTRHGRRVKIMTPVGGTIADEERHEDERELEKESAW